ncbi:hypothetical protein [Achromobacter aegrifaciens]|uniref:Uncharacterized protein n=1 Tax=Achromobacter aegrifaciens TaxID=1287736 RepID=A0AAD2IYA7_ACHAE|nr:hypothetical protein [Achromobacter aegrifaciens]CUI91478.1 Uncharacterised protein [Achromobacter aegrifaciens]
MNWTKVLEDMLTAAEKSAGGAWAKLESYAEQEFQTLVGVASKIQKRQAEKTITEVNAHFLMDQYRLAAKAVLFAIVDLSNIVIQNSWNAAMAVLRKAISSAIGWPLLA